MNITPSEAQEALNDIDQIMSRTRKMLSRGNAPYQLILWGAIWFVGYLATAFLRGPITGLLWMALLLIGFVFTAYLAHRDKQRVKYEELGKRIGFSWISLFIFAAALLWAASPKTVEQANLILILIIMFGYALMGIWVWRSLLWTGLLVSALAIIGYLFFFDSFFLWMAVLGGGALAGSGFYFLKAGG